MDRQYWKFFKIIIKWMGQRKISFYNAVIFISHDNGQVFVHVKFMWVTINDIVMQCKLEEQ